MVGVEVAQDDCVVAGGEGARVEPVLSIVIGGPADGRPVDVPDRERGLAEDAHATHLGAVVRGGERAVGQGGKRDATTNVDGHVPTLYGRRTCESTARSSGEDRRLKARKADSGLGGELGLLYSHYVCGYRREPALELRDLGPESLSVPSDDTEEASLRSVATVAAVPCSPATLSPSGPPVVTPLRRCSRRGARPPGYSFSRSGRAARGSGPAVGMRSPVAVPMRDVKMDGGGAERRAGRHGPPTGTLAERARFGPVWLTTTGRPGHGEPEGPHLPPLEGGPIQEA